MAGEAAITKVKNTLLTWLTGNIGSGVTITLDRAFDQPYHDEELPTVNIRCQQTDYDVFGYSGWLHSAAIMFDVVTRSSTTLTIDKKQAEIAADIVARIAARTSTAGTIGELLQDALPVSMGSSGADMELSDQGETTLQYRMTYLTPINDFRTIAGQNGLVA